MTNSFDQQPLLRRLQYFLNPVDGRFEDLKKGNLALNVLKDVMAGLIVAMVAIPLAMGFAIASGLRPEQGIVGGAVAGLVGALFGGSKYQVYGPTAAFIPIIASIMEHHDHSFLVLASLLGGILLMLMGMFRFGKIVKLVPHSIVVGFTIGIAITIAFSQVGEVLGLHAKMSYDFLGKLKTIATHIGEFNPYALGLALGTLVLTKWMFRISVYIPGPVVSVAVGTILTANFFADKGLTLIKTKYLEIPTDLWKFTPHTNEGFDYPFALLYYAVAIVFVSAIESLLCSRMADRLAHNTGQPFNPDKELFGQGLVQMIVPALNGFPHTGALARTATNIKLGAISPLAGIFKFIFKLLMAMHLADYLEEVPMACIGGILAYVAMNMVKKGEIDEVRTMGKFHWGLMIYTAIAVIVTDFLTGVLTALIVAIIHGLVTVTVQLIPEEGFWRVRIEGGLTFLSSASVTKALQQIPAGQDVMFDLRLRFMESTGWEALQLWASQHVNSGGKVDIQGVSIVPRAPTDLL